MKEMENVMDNVEVIDNVEVTDLATQDSSKEGGLGAAEITILALAGVGVAFLGKKTVDGVKWVGGKVTSWNENRKAKKAEKKAAKEVPAEEETEADETVEVEIVEEVPAEDKKKKK